MVVVRAGRQRAGSPGYIGFPHFPPQLLRVNMSPGAELGRDASASHCLGQTFDTYGFSEHSRLNQQHGDNLAIIPFL